MLDNLTNCQLALPSRTNLQQRNRKLVGYNDKYVEYIGKSLPIGLMNVSQLLKLEEIELHIVPYTINKYKLNKQQVNIKRVKKINKKTQKITTEFICRVLASRSSI